MASGLTDKAKDTASNLYDKAKDAASGLADRAGSVASGAMDKAEDATGAMGHGMRSLADTIDRGGPDGGMLGTAASAVADSLRTGGEYLEQHGLSGIADDLTDLIKRNPIPALFVGIGIGYLLARATRS